MSSDGTSVEHANPRRLSVLVVEDDPDTGDSLAELLKLSGHEVVVTRCGEDAVPAAAAGVDVIFLDLRLPGIDGCEVARQVCSMGSPKRPLLVAVTGRGADEDFRRSREAGIDLHLIKPVEPSLLLALLSRIAAGTPGPAAPQSSGCG